MKRVFCWPVCLLCFMLVAAGCGSDPESAVPQDTGPALSAVAGGETLADGRSVGGYAEAGLGDTLVNQFFAFSVDTVRLTEEYEGQTPKQGCAFLAADLTVQNTFDGSLDIWTNEFKIKWGDGERDFGYPQAAFAEGQMADEYELPKDGSVAGTLIYEVPRPEETHTYSISYLEYYADEVEGNDFIIRFDLAPPGEEAVAGSGEGDRGEDDSTSGTGDSAGTGVGR